MFESLQFSLVPVCALAALAGLLLSRWRRRLLSLLSAASIAVGIACFWWWLPQLLWPQEHTDPQEGWGLVAVFYWSLFAIPVAIATHLLAGIRRARSYCPMTAPGR